MAADSRQIGRIWRACVKIHIQLLGLRSWPAPLGQPQDADHPHTAPRNKGQHIPRPHPMGRLGAGLPIQAQVPVKHHGMGQFARFEKAGCEQPFI